ncbi:MAG: hypothetical protein WDO15_17245 [Bacteroidota bacterium]
MHENLCASTDYSTTNVDYKNYDPPRNLAPLLPEHAVDHVIPQ